MCLPVLSTCIIQQYSPLSPFCMTIPKRLPFLLTANVPSSRSQQAGHFLLPPVRDNVQVV